MKSKYFFEENYTYCKDTSAKYFRAKEAGFEGCLIYNIEAVSERVVRGLDLEIRRKRCIYRYEK